MARVLRLVVMASISVLAGSGLLGEAVNTATEKGLLPQAGPAEAAEIDWQLAFPKGDFEEDTYEPGAPPANHDFEDGLTSWTGQGMTLGTSGPTGDYGVITDSTVESPAIEITNNGEGTHLITMDVGFLATNTEDLSCVGVTAVLESEDMENLWFTCENEDLPIWRTLSKTLSDIPVDDPIVMLMITTHGTVGIDNVGESLVPVPGWYSSWSGDIPTIEESGPEGNYLHLETTEEESSAGAMAEIPSGAISLVYWRRVSEGGSGAIHFTLSNGEEGENEDFAMITDYIEEGDGEWVKRSVDLACPPMYPEDGFSGDCEIVYIDVQNWSGFLDFALSTSSDADADEDGLYDDWEEYGVLREGPEPEDGNFIDLPAIGADPDKPDIFVHLDYMCRAEDEEEQEGDCDEEHPTVLESAKISSNAIEKVVEAFYNSPYESPTASVGINLWVDQGPDSILDYRSDPPTTWGSLSAAGPITYDAVLGSGDYDWGEFDDYKLPRLIEKGRLPIFHYAIAGDRFGSSGNDKSGKSRGIDASDFIVTLGSFDPKFGTENDQAGVFMHELGHNLGLHHGGDSGENYKPNYPSVMNYSYFLSGIIKNGAFGTYDYSRVDPDLDEEHLDESEGVPDAPYGYGASYYCGSTRKDKADWTAPIDWNCDNDTNDTGAFNVNKTEGAILLSGFNDWDSINFWGGAIGADGDSQVDDYEEVDELGFEEAVRKGLISLEGRPGIQKYMEEKGIPMPQDDLQQRLSR